MHYGKLSYTNIRTSQAFKAYRTLRLERMNVRQVGPRKKKAEELAKEEAVRKNPSFFHSPLCVPDQIVSR